MLKSDLINSNDILELQALKSSLVPDDKEKIALALSYSVGLKIIRKVLGNSWVDEKISIPQKTISSDINWYYSTSNGFIPFKIIYLANYLFNLCENKGFKRRIDSFRKRPIESLLFELYIASSLKNDLNLSFIKESGLLGYDYEFRLWIEGITYSCEVEYIYDKPEKQLKTIENKLHHARKQLPKNGNGILFLRIPKYLAPDNQQKFIAIQDLLRNFFRNTNRVKYIYFYIEDFIVSDTGLLLAIEKRRWEFGTNAFGLSIFKPIKEKNQKIGKMSIPQNYLNLDIVESTKK